MLRLLPWALPFLLLACRQVPAPPSPLVGTEAPPPDSLARFHYEALAEVAVENADFLTTDRLMNCYVVGNGDELRKYSPEGTELYLYSDNNYGDIHHVDASNPFHILVYHADFQTVAILDQRLSPNARFDLNAAGILSAKAVGISSDQYVWVYDELDTRLKKIDHTGKVLTEGENLSVRPDLACRPNHLMESGNQLYLNTAGEDLRRFDLFGKFLGTEPIRPDGRFQVEDGIITHQAGTYRINRYAPKYDTSGQLLFPYGKPNGKGMEARKDRLYYLEGARLVIYKMSPKK